MSRFILVAPLLHGRFFLAFPPAAPEEPILVLQEEEGKRRKGAQGLIVSPLASS